MAQIVGAFATSHTPQILVQPKISEEFTRQLQEVHKALMEVGKRIRNANADTIIIFGSDHMETFWLNNYPQLLLFTGNEVGGRFAGVELKLPGNPELAKELLYGLIDYGFDVSFSLELELDHPYISPLYWILKGAQHDSYQPRLIPFHINSNVDPRIKPRRAYELGADDKGRPRKLQTPEQGRPYRHRRTFALRRDALLRKGGRRGRQLPD